MHPFAAGEVVSASAMPVTQRTPNPVANLIPKAPQSITTVCNAGIPIVLIGVLAEVGAATWL